MAKELLASDISSDAETGDHAKQCTGKTTGLKPNWNDTSPSLSKEAVKWIRRKVEGLSFGDVKISVRHGKIVQIDREEKERHHEVADNH